VLLNERGRHDEAIAACRQAIAVRPDYPEAHNNLGNALQALGRFEEAVAAYRTALELRPDYTKAASNFGGALQGAGKLDEAGAVLRDLLKTTPDFAEAHNNLGGVLIEQGKFDEAIASIRRALSLRTDYLDAWNNLGNALMKQGRPDEAIAALRGALALNPDQPLLRFGLGSLLLLKGDFSEGWREYEQRWRVPELGLQRFAFVQPRWAGEPLDGRRILLWSEQGFGDTIQFARYAPEIVKRGGRIVLGVQPDLERLMRSMEGVERLVTQAQPEEFDAHLPLLSLPLVLGTTVETIPAAVPYLHADAALVQRWRERISQHAEALKVGVVWAGRPTHKNDRNRSMPLEKLKALQAIDGIWLLNLQKGETARRALEAPDAPTLTDWTSELNDFAETAALIECLDLVITVDTSVVHLTGALGKPVWVLLPFMPDWRWLLGRDDSPWYPSARLFRQPFAGDWDSVIEAVVRALQEHPFLDPHGSR
jgi:Flp pilus assembly protein TadD